MPKTNFHTIDEYIQIFPKDVQIVLQEVKQTIMDVVPNAQETISYQIPTFKLNGSYLVYFAGWKNHISLYPVSVAMENSIKELSKYKTSGKGTVQFPLDKPIPLGLITKITKFRIKENLENRKRKSKK